MAYRKGEIAVILKNGVTRAQLEEVLKPLGLSIVRESKRGNWCVVEVFVGEEIKYIFVLKEYIEVVQDAYIVFK